MKQGIPKLENDWKRKYEQERNSHDFTRKLLVEYKEIAVEYKESAIVFESALTESRNNINEIRSISVINERNLKNEIEWLRQRLLKK